MEEILVIIVFIIWYVLAMVISENIGKKRKLGVEWSFFLCIMLSPIIGYAITRLSPKT